jgi:uncharacterized membrane protein
MRPARSPLHLVATLGLALLGLAGALLPIESWVRFMMLVPLVFALPGYAVVCALLPSGMVPAAERAVYTVALSIAISVLSAVTVQLVLALDRTIWVLVLTLVTVTASVAALRRGRPWHWRQRPRPTMPMLSPASSLAIVVAVGLAAWAVSIASAGARRDRVESHFTELWLLPANVAPPGGDAVAIGVENHEGVPVSYLVRITQPGIQIADRTIRLRDGERWRTRLLVRGISSADPVEVTLVREGEVYRRAYLQSGLRP